MSGWSEEQGRVSRAFNEWWLVERDQRAFLRLGLAFAKAEYERLWRKSAKETYYDGAPELPDSFEAKVDSLYPQDFNWMFLSGVLRDAVTNFEVYLEKAREEVLRHQGQPISVRPRAPYRQDLTRFFEQLGVNIEAPAVKRVQKLRDFLTHRRGELRTQELREEFQKTHTDDFPPLAVQLAEEGVAKSMSVLGDAARSIDAVVYQHTWGGTPLPDLKP